MIDTAPPEDPGVCGDGVLDAGEDCDDGGETETCNSDCTESTWEMAFSTRPPVKCVR